MVSRRTFTKGQWAAALGIALSAHALLAWALLALVPEKTASPAVQGSGLAVDSLSFGAADLPLLTAVAASAPEPIEAAAAAALDDLLPLVAPPRIRSMTDVVPVKQKPRRAKAPKVKTKTKTKAKAKRAPSKAQEPAAKKSRSRKSAKSPAARRAGVDNPGQASANKRNNDGAASGGKKGRPPGAVAGLDRGAAPVPGNPRPEYPRVARSRGEEGRVLIRISVLGSGRVDSASIARSSGHSALDRAALKAVKRWRFRPALRAGTPVKAELTVPVVFRLKG